MLEYTAQHWLPSHSGLGESPLYRRADDSFFFVDIKQQLVHMVPQATQGARETAWDRRRTLNFSESITRLNVVAGSTDELAVQTKLGFAILHLANGTLASLGKIHYADDASLDAKVRMNDGGIDAEGRWWAGTMALDGHSDIGRLWTLADGKVTDMSATTRPNGLSTIPNGPAWSPDDKTMYACETPQHKVFAYDYSTATGAATNPRLFAELADGGMPDGVAVDVEGHVWVAANGKSELRRFSPQGELVAVTKIPGANGVTCPAFGGDDMKTLFITSIAGEGSSGDVYTVEVDVPGIQQHAYKGKRSPAT